MEAFAGLPSKDQATTVTVVIPPTEPLRVILGWELDELKARVASLEEMMEKVGEFFAALVELNQA